MFKSLCQRITGLASAFLAVQKGSILIYTGAFMSIGVGGAAISIDIGRIVLLRTQMQNRADAGALAGAAQLDAQDGAIERADVVITDSMAAFTTALQQSGQPLPVLSSIYYLPDTVTATEPGAVSATCTATGCTPGDDAAVRFVRVNMVQQTVSFFYAPAMNLLGGGGASNNATLDSTAVAMTDPFICGMQPLMMCDPYEGMAQKLADDPGVLVRIKQSGQTGSMGHGNFGLLDLPEDGGADSIQDALEAENPGGCYALTSLALMSGNKTGQVRKGINVRFGEPEGDPEPIPAPNVMNYPRDNDMYVPDPVPNIGDGVWDFTTYWGDRHPAVAEPAVLTDPSRYQVYLFELGIPFWRDGKATSIEPQGGPWTYVDPLLYPLASVIPTNPGDPHDNWTDGEPPTPPQTVSVQGQARRLIRAALIDCTANPPHNDPVPSNGQFIEFFINEQSDEIDGATIYGEVLRGLDAPTSFEFHGNVRLIE